jgi:glutathionyl-hydroquinone reductase
VTLVRFDSVYAVHFKTNFASVRGSDVLLGYVRDVFNSVGGDGGARVGTTVHFDHIKAHYYRSHTHINPFGIVPLGPPDEQSEFDKPSGRETL